jgi:hypothetical protein
MSCLRLDVSPRCREGGASDDDVESDNDSNRPPTTWGNQRDICRRTRCRRRSRLSSTPTDHTSIGGDGVMA